MSKRELERVEALARVQSKQLLVIDAGRLMQVSYRQAKRLWKRYREEGAAGLQQTSEHLCYRQWPRQNSGFWSCQGQFRQGCV